jgi:YD repeat-containing protein
LDSKGNSLKAATFFGTNSSSKTVKWDAENRVTGVTGGASFVYDGNGNRVKQTVGSVMTTYGRFLALNLKAGLVRLGKTEKYEIIVIHF